MPLVRAGSHKASLGADDQVLRIGVQRLADELFTDVRAVGVGRVDEVDAEFDRSPQYREGLVAVLRFAPNAGAGDLHSAVAEAVHREIAAE
jgi:hypothetical protein